jgi:hypothetical protein
MRDWLIHLFTTGLLTLLAPTAILLVSLRWGRAAFDTDYPPDIQAEMPPFSRRDTVRAWILGPAFILTLLGACFYTAWSWLDADPARTYLDAFGMAFGTFALFALIDLLIIDWLVICFWRPHWVMIPGTENCAGWGDYAFHVKAQFGPKGIVALIGLPAVLAGVATLLA